MVEKIVSVTEFEIYLMSQDICLFCFHTKQNKGLCFGGEMFLGKIYDFSPSAAILLCGKPITEFQMTLNKIYIYIMTTD